MNPWFAEAPYISSFQRQDRRETKKGTWFVHGRESKKGTWCNSSLSYDIIKGTERVGAFLEIVHRASDTLGPSAKPRDIEREERVHRPVKAWKNCKRRYRPRAFV